MYQVRTGREDGREQVFGADLLAAELGRGAEGGGLKPKRKVIDCIHQNICKLDYDCSAGEACPFYTFDKAFSGSVENTYPPSCETYFDEIWEGRE